MTSTRLMLWLILNYAVIAAASAHERNWARVLYFVAAILITLAVMWMPSFQGVQR